MEVSEQRRNVVTGCAMALVVVVGVIDHVAGPHLAFSIFYVIPIFVGAWYGGSSAGFVVAVESALVGLVADITVPGDRGSVFPYLNAVSRLALLVLIAELLSQARRRMDQDRRTAERERAVADQLRELDEMKDAFLHSVAHDLRGPLGGILGSAVSLARDDGALSPQDKKLLAEGIVSMARRTSRIVADLLDAERLRHGILQPDRSLVDVGALVRSLVEERGQRAGHTIMVQAPSVTAWVDPMTVERILENLLENVEKHTPAGTRVWVRVEDRGDLLITVEDDGPGVPADMRQRIFEMFRQGEGGENVPGLGLGLHIVARFAELHDGRAWVTEREGGGASFRVLLPASIEAIQRQPA